MATGTSFKQQCPSCEAMVPIRDPGLVGRKIDCPKCKYRFVVQAHDDEDEDATPVKTGKAGDSKVTTKPAAKGGPGKPGKKGEGSAARPALKKKAGGSSKVLVLGIGLAVVAVLAIVVCVIALWPS